MSRRNVWLGVISAIVILLIGGIVLQQAGVAQARMPAPQGAAGLTIPYVGHLTNAAGEAVVDGTYAVTFALYSSLDGGEPLWSETQEGVSVQAGDFVVALGSVNPLSADTLGGLVWLEVAVRGPNDAAFTTLAPRQILDTVGPDVAGIQAAPCAHDHWGEMWSGTGLGLGLTGTYTNNEILYIANYANSGDGVRAYNSGPDYNDGALKGANLSTGSGVYGSSTSGTGVYGRSGWVGVWGESTATVNAVGVAGQANSTACNPGLSGCFGVQGVAPAGYGVEGYTDSGVALHGYANSNGVGLRVDSQIGGDLIQAYHGPLFSDLRFLVTNAGEVYADGTFHTPTPGFAQMLPGAPGLEAGDVLVMGADGQAVRCTEANQTAVIGIYAPDAGFVAGVGQDNVPAAGQVAVLMMGVIPVKVSAENGPIAPGDLLVTAATPGYAMKATPITVSGVTFYPSGVILGKALEALPSGTGTISVLVTLK